MIGHRRLISVVCKPEERRGRCARPDDIDPQGDGRPHVTSLILDAGAEPSRSEVREIEGALVERTKPGMT